jgi:hypothetical protein
VGPINRLEAQTTKAGARVICAYAKIRIKKIWWAASP